MILKKAGCLLLLVTGIAACTPEQCTEGLEAHPMYGSVAKCATQREADKRFLDSCDQQFHSRKMAASAYVTKAWEFFERNDQSNAMLAFNQAWLLDSTNADVYWGFGNLLGFREEFAESLPYFRKSLALNPTNPDVYDCIATSMGQLFVSTSQDSFLYQTIGASMRSLQLNPVNARAYATLASAYTYFSQHDSARKYMALADQLDPAAVNPGVRTTLQQEQPENKVRPAGK
jgi:tetratricopeptide (TPR) repeat protein